MEYAKMKPPIFIIGNPRSGTTLLRLMLTCHHNIVIPPECGFAIWWHKKYKNWDVDSSRCCLNEFMNDLFNSRKFETWNLKRELLEQFLAERRDQNYSDLISSIYEFYARQQKEKFERWGDKNNFHINHIETISGLFSEAKFIHIVRDGRDIACSYRKLYGEKFDSQYAPKLA